MGLTERHWFENEDVPENYEWALEDAVFGVDATMLKEQEPKNVENVAQQISCKSGLCPSCGKMLNTTCNRRFCGECGKAVKWE